MTGPTHDYVGKPMGGLIYVIVGEREKFDAIEIEERVTDNGCHLKCVGDMLPGTTTVIFQWWETRASAAPCATEAV